MRISRALLPLVHTHLRLPFPTSRSTAVHAPALPVVRSSSSRVVKTGVLPPSVLLVRSRACFFINMTRSGRHGRASTKTRWNKSTASVATGAKRGSATTGLARQRQRAGAGASVDGGAQLFFSGLAADDSPIGDAHSEWEFVNDDPAWMTVEDLKRALRGRKLKVSGRKQELIERLRAARKEGEHPVSGTETVTPLVCRRYSTI